MDFTIPSITIIETVHLKSNSETSNVSEHLLAPEGLMEESSSDYGYESYDSPVSEPNQLFNFFPELW